MLLNIIIGTLFAKSLIIAWKIYGSKVDLSTKILIFPFLVVCIYCGVDLYKQNLGTPQTKYPTSEFVYVYHKFSADGRWIYIWIDDEESGDKLYKVPYTRRMAEDIGEAASATEEDAGAGIVGQFVFRDGELKSPKLKIEIVRLYDPRNHIYKMQQQHREVIPDATRMGPR